MTQFNQAEISFVPVTETDLGTFKTKEGFDLIKVGKVSRTVGGVKSSMYVGRVCYVPSLSLTEIKAELGEMGTEASAILQEYFTQARSTFIRERIIEGLSSIPSSLCEFSKRSLWLAFNGVSDELANMFVAQVIQTRCEEFAFMAAAKSLGFSSLEEVPAEQEAELIAKHGALLPTFIQAASSDRNREFLLSLVTEGRILSRIGKFSEAQCNEGLKWINGVENPITVQVTGLLNQRIQNIQTQVANLGIMSEELSVMAEYFK